MSRFNSRSHIELGCIVFREQMEELFDVVQEMFGPHI